MSWRGRYAAPLLIMPKTSSNYSPSLFNVIEKTGTDNGSMWRDDYQYGIPSAGETANAMAGSVIDPDGLVSGLYNDIMGFTSQSREFQQQEYMQDKQNAWDSAGAKMARLKEAGINLNTAAAGVAGSGGSGFAPPAGSANAQGLGAAASALDTAAQSGSRGAAAELDLANADLARANARNVDMLANSQVLDTASKLVTSFVGAGLPEIGAGLMALDIARGGTDSIVKYLQAYDGLRNVDSKVQLLKDEHEKRLKELGRYDEMLQSTIDETNARALKEQKEAAIADENAKYQQMVNDLYKEVPGFDLPGFNQMRLTGEKFGYDSIEYQQVGKAIYDSSYNNERGKFNAEVDTAYQKFYNEYLAKAKVDASFAPYMSFIEQNEYWIKSTIDVLYKTQSNPLGTLDNIVRIVANKIGTSVGGSPIPGVSQPRLEPVGSDTIK